jgi:hypothetical protein
VVVRSRHASFLPHRANPKKTLQIVNEEQIDRRKCDAHITKNAFVDFETLFPRALNAKRKTPISRRQVNYDLREKSTPKPRLQHLTFVFS